MNDLLGDSFSNIKSQISRGRDIESGLQASTSTAVAAMEEFFNEIREIEQQIDKISKHLKSLQDAHEESKSVTKAATMRAIKHRMEKDVDDVKTIAVLVNKKLDQINKDNLSNRQKPGCGKGSGVDRSRTQMTHTLKKKMKDRMSEFQTLRQAIQEEYHEVIERRIFTVTGIRPDEETIDELIETGNSEQIFQKAIQGQGRGQIMDTLAEIQERHDAVIDLEKKLLDLQQIFLDMVVLVDAQGDMLDNIENHVSTAVDHVGSANNALRRAKSLQRNSRKWMCIGIIILLVIIIIIVVPILTNWKKRI